MKALYKLYAVDPKKNKVVVDGENIIASNSDNARVQAGVILGRKGLNVDEVDIQLACIGTFIREDQKT